MWEICLEQKGKWGEKSIIKAEVSEEMLVTVLPSSASCLPHLPFLQLYPRMHHVFTLRILYMNFKSCWIKGAK